MTSKFRKSLLFLALAWHSAFIWADVKTSIGWIETVRISKDLFELDAKIDTGADHSSIHAQAVSAFSKDGQPWVRFYITDKAGLDHALERPVVKYSFIKRMGTDSQRRPAIKLGICLADHYREVMVNLTDRSHYRYPMLIGRSYLDGLFTVDPELSHRTLPQCKP